MNKHFRRAALFLSATAAGLVGCYSNVSPPEPATSRMQELCARNGGLRKTGPSIAVNGFFENGGRGCEHYCRVGLMEGFDYVEAYASGPSVLGLVPREGLYRFSMKAAGDPSCEPHYKYSGVRPGQEPKTGKCIGSELIANAKSKYRVGSVSKREVIGGGTLNMHQEYVEDIETGQRVAELNAYHLRWTGVAVLPGQGDRFCPEYPRGLKIRDVLTPVPE